MKKKFEKSEFYQDLKKLREFEEEKKIIEKRGELRVYYNEYKKMKSKCNAQETKIDWIQSIGLAALEESMCLCSGECEGRRMGQCASCPFNDYCNIKK